jgi:hypothetical protein
MARLGNREKKIAEMVAEAVVAVNLQNEIERTCSNIALRTLLKAGCVWFLSEFSFPKPHLQA